MNWISIGLAAGAGAIAGVVAHFVARGMTSRRTGYLVAFVVTFGLLNAVAQTVVLPRLDTGRKLERAEAELQAIPAFQMIKKHDATTYNAIIADLKAGLEAGKSEEALGLELKPRVEKLVAQRLPLASDAAVNTYVGVMVQELRALTRKDPNLCYQFLFPQQFGPIGSVQKHLPQDIWEADLAALATVIQSSAEAPQPIPTQEDIATDMQVAVQRLHQKHGDRIAVLENPLEPSINRAEACVIFADLYESVLSLEPARSSKVLRFMFSQA